MSFIPEVYGVSALQRQSRAILDKLKKIKQPIFLTERNKVSYVMLTAEAFVELSKEDYGWMAAQSQSLSFWQDPSNDAYDAL